MKKKIIYFLKSLEQFLMKFDDLEGIQGKIEKVKKTFHDFFKSVGLSFIMFNHLKAII